MTLFSKETEFQDETFSKLDLENKIISHKFFFDCVFKNCNFSYANFQSSLFEDCFFLNCNFSLTKMLKAQIRGVVFDSCKIIGVDFTKCDTLIMEFSIEESTIKNCIFSDLCLRKTKLYKSDLIECDFVNTDLSETNLFESNFSGSLFHNTNLMGANLINCANYNIDPLKNNIKKAKFSLPEALSLLNFFEITIQ